MAFIIEDHIIIVVVGCIVLVADYNDLDIAAMDIVLDYNITTVDYHIVHHIIIIIDIDFYSVEGIIQAAPVIIKVKMVQLRLCQTFMHLDEVSLTCCYCSTKSQDSELAAILCNGYCLLELTQ